jgi:hypothetical protein
MRCLAYAVAFVVGTTGCGVERRSPAPQCRAQADCDDGNECTDDVCSTDGCVHEEREGGSSCSAGFCDTGAVCRSECDHVPCLDSYVEEPYGCVYEQRPNGWTCTTDGGALGLCANGSCSTSEGK